MKTIKVKGTKNRKAHTRNIDGSTKIDITSHPDYVKTINHLSDIHHEDLQGDGSFPRGHEAHGILKAKRDQIRKSLSKKPPKEKSKSSIPKKPKRSSGVPKMAAKKQGGRKKFLKNHYRIMGTNQYKKG